jgi:hypothetical protein
MQGPVNVISMRVISRPDVHESRLAQEEGLFGLCSR